MKRLFHNWFCSEEATGRGGMAKVQIFVFRSQSRRVGMTSLGNKWLSIDRTGSLESPLATDVSMKMANLLESLLWQSNLKSRIYLGNCLENPSLERLHNHSRWMWTKRVKALSRTSIFVSLRFFVSMRLCHTMHESNTTRFLLSIARHGTVSFIVSLRRKKPSLSMRSCFSSVRWAVISPAGVLRMQCPETYRSLSGIFASRW